MLKARLKVQKAFSLKLSNKIVHLHGAHS